MTKAEKIWLFLFIAFTISAFSCPHTGNDFVLFIIAGMCGAFFVGSGKKQ